MKTMRLIAAAIAALAVLASHAQIQVKKNVTDSAGNALPANGLIAPDTLLKYRIQVQNTASSYLAPAQLIDTMSTTQRYVAGTLRAPADWTSTANVFDGSNVATIATGPIFPNGAIGKLIPLTTALTSAFTSSATSGDGLMPIIDPATGSIFVVYHHAGGPAYPNAPARVLCRTLADGSPCSGYGTTGLTLRSSNTAPQNDLMTNSYGEQFIVGTRLYYTAAHYRDATATAIDVGLGCWDTTTKTNCSFVPVATNLSAAMLGVALDSIGVANAFSAQRVDAVSNNIIFSVNGQLSCYSLSTFTPCSSFSPAQPTTIGQPLTTVLDVYNGRYVVSGRTDAANATLTVDCYDMVTASACAGGRRSYAISTGVALLNSLWPYGVPGQARGYCLTRSTGTASGVTATECFDWSGATLPTPVFERTTTTDPWLSGNSGRGGAANGQIQSSGYINVPGTQRVIYPGLNGPTCYDYATSAPCVGFTDVLGIPGKRDWRVPSKTGAVAAAAQSTYDYGYTYYQGCAYALGDAGQLLSFDPYTAATPCASGGTVLAQARPAQQYCDGNAHVTAWSNLSVQSLPSNTYSVTVTVRADDGTVLIPTTVKQTSGTPVTIDLSNISYAAYPSLSFDIQIAATAADNASQPAAVITFTSDRNDQDVCYAARVTNVCQTATAITNDAILRTSSGVLLASASPTSSGHATSMTCSADSPEPQPVPANNTVALLLLSLLVSLTAALASPTGRAK